MSNLLNKKHALAKLRAELEGKGSCVDAVRSSGTWPETARIREGRKRGLSFPRINLKY